MNAGLDQPEPLKLPIGSELDLHTFQPREAKELVVDYLEQARRRGLRSVRIVHGKGSGSLRATVRAVLARRPDLVRRVCDGGTLGGSWGVTVAYLTPSDGEADGAAATDPEGGDTA